GDAEVGVGGRDAANEREDADLVGKLLRGALVVGGVAAIVADVELEQAMADASGGVDHLQVRIDGLDVRIELPRERSGLRRNETDLDLARRDSLVGRAAGAVG